MDADAKKTTLRMIPYGIYVLTADDGKGNIGAATVNWVTQASFAPPLVVVGVKADSGAHTVVKPRIVPETESGISTHQQGSCRMGKDPASSVVDATGRVHEVSNVYVADGSLLPNPGGANPSLTIQALACRMGDRIRSLASRREL